MWGPLHSLMFLSFCGYLPREGKCLVGRHTLSENRANKICSWYSEIISRILGPALRQPRCGWRRDGEGLQPEGTERWYWTLRAATTQEGRAGSLQHGSRAFLLTTALGIQVLNTTYACILSQEDNGRCSQCGISALEVYVSYCIQRPAGASCHWCRRCVMIPWLVQELLITLPFESVDYHE